MYPQDELTYNLEEDDPRNYLRNAKALDYEETGFLACSQVDQSTVAIVGAKSWLIQLATQSET